MNTILGLMGWIVLIGEFTIASYLLFFLWKGLKYIFK